MLLVYLAFLYGLAFFFLLPERIAPPLTILLTTMFYAVIAMFLWLDERIEQPAENILPDQEIIRGPDLARYLGLAVLLVILFCLLPVVGTAAGVVLYIACTAAGPLLAAGILLSVIRKKAARE